MQYLKSNLKKTAASVVMCLAVFMTSAVSLNVSADTVTYFSNSAEDFYIDGYSDEDIEMLCAVVEREVGGLSTASKQAVTSVIINRVNSPLFPDTVYDVLHQPNQFKTIRNYYTNERPVQVSTRIAVLYALKSGLDCAGGSLYFYAPKVIDSVDKSNWFESNLEFTMEIDGQRYFK